MHWQTIQVDSDWILSRPMTQFNPFPLAWKHVKRHHCPCDRGFKRWQYTVTAWTGLENMYNHPWQCELGLKTCHEHIFVERFETVCQQPGVLLDITSMTMWQGLEILHIQPWRCEGGLKTCKRIHDSVTGAWQPCQEQNYGRKAWKWMSVARVLQCENSCDHVNWASTVKILAWLCDRGFKTWKTTMTMWTGLDI